MSAENAAGNWVDCGRRWRSWRGTSEAQAPCPGSHCSVNFACAACGGTGLRRL